MDGVDNWAMLSEGAGSARHEVLLDLQATACNGKGAQGAATPCNVPGSGALRVGRWKLIHGHAGVWSAGEGAGGAWCTARTGVAGAGKPVPFPLPANESNPWCPYGWTPPPGSGLLPQPAPEVATAGCKVGPGTTGNCSMPPDSHYLSGGTMLFDVVADMEERHDVAAANPGVVAQLLARLQQFNASHCGGQRCLPDNAGGARGTPTKNPSQHGATAVWLPWRGNTNPARCDTNRSSLVPTPPPTPVPAPTPAPQAGLHSSLAVADIGVAPAAAGGLALRGTGWCWYAALAGGGVPAMTVRVSVDGALAGTTLANITRPKLMSQTGAPNNEHGFDLSSLGGAAAAAAAAALGAHDGSVHRLDLDAYLDATPTASAKTAPLRGSPLCFRAGMQVPCPQ